MRAELWLCMCAGRRMCCLGTGFLSAEVSVSAVVVPGDSRESHEAREHEPASVALQPVGDGRGR